MWPFTSQATRSATRPCILHIRSFPTRIESNEKRVMKDAAFDHFLVRSAEGVEVSPASTTKTGRDVNDRRALTVTLTL